jgi:hypothetical protein
MRYLKEWKKDLKHRAQRNRRKPPQVAVELAYSFVPICLVKTSQFPIYPDLTVLDLLNRGHWSLYNRMISVLIIGSNSCFAPFLCQTT